MLLVRPRHYCCRRIVTACIALTLSVRLAGSLASPTSAALDPARSLQACSPIGASLPDISFLDECAVIDLTRSSATSFPSSWYAHLQQCELVLLGSGADANSALSNALCHDCPKIVASDYSFCMPNEPVVFRVVSISGNWLDAQSAVEECGGQSNQPKSSVLNLEQMALPPFNASNNPLGAAYIMTAPRFWRQQDSVDVTSGLFAFIPPAIWTVEQCIAAIPAQVYQIFLSDTLSADARSAYQLANANVYRLSSFGWSVPAGQPVVAGDWSFAWEETYVTNVIVYGDGTGPATSVNVPAGALDTQFASSEADRSTWRWLTIRGQDGATVDLQPGAIHAANSRVVFSLRGSYFFRQGAVVGNNVVLLASSLQLTHIEAGSLATGIAAISTDLDECGDPATIAPLGSPFSEELRALADKIPALDDDGDRPVATPCSCSQPGDVRVGYLCALAPSGQVANNGELTPCPKGTFSDIDGASGTTADACSPCPAGSYNPLRGQSSVSCIFCPAGTAQATAGATSVAECGACAAGTFAAGLGNAECAPCAQGSYAAATGSRQCTPCPAGTYGTQLGATSATSGCTPCPAGSFTAGPGTATEAGCIAGAASSCPAGQDRDIATGQCVTLQCNGSLVLDTTSGQCVGCPPGTLFNGSACTACGEGQLCPGGTSHAVIASAALAARSPEVASAAGKRAEVVPVPSSSLLAQATLLIVTLALAIAIPLLIAAVVPGAPEKVREIYRNLDLFGLDHKQEEGTAKILKRTPLGSALTLSMMVLVLALSISSLIDFVEDNFQVDRTLEPTPESIPGIAGMRTSSAGVFITVHQEAWSDCAPTGDVLAITGPGAQQWAAASAETRSGGAGSGISCTYRISCSNCVLSPDGALDVSLTAPFHAQSAVWGMHTDRAWTPEMHLQPKHSTVGGGAEGSAADGPLSSVTWSVSAIRSVVHDERSEEYAYGYILAQAGENTQYTDASRLTSGFLPGANTVTYRVSVSVPITAQGTSITARSTLVSLLGALGGLLGGITGLFHALFPQAERGVAALLRKGKCTGALRYLADEPGAGAAAGAATAAPVAAAAASAQKPKTAKRPTDKDKTPTHGNTTPPKPAAAPAPAPAATASTPTTRPNRRIIARAQAVQAMGQSGHLTQTNPMLQ